MALPEPVEVYDASEEPITVVPGLIDEDTRWVYTHGQCLALAVALSQRTGWPVLLNLFLDGDAADPCGTYPNLRHAAVMHPTGVCIDISGAHPRPAQGSDPSDLPDRLVQVHDAAGLLDEFAGFLPPQDLDTASAFTATVLDVALIDICSSPACG